VRLQPPQRLREVAKHVHAHHLTVLHAYDDVIVERRGKPERGFDVGEEVDGERGVGGADVCDDEGASKTAACQDGRFRWVPEDALDLVLVFVGLQALASHEVPQFCGTVC